MGNFIKGSHNSATGEKSANLLSKLVRPFAKCQSKTLKQQLDEGVQAFDFRVVYKDGKLTIVHGLWSTNLNINTTLKKIANYAKKSGKDYYVRIIYKGKLFDHNYVSFISWYKKVPNKTLVKYHIVNKEGHSLYKNFTNHCEHLYKDLSINFKSFYWLIPIPWLWNKLTKPNIIDKVANLLNHQDVVLYNDFV